MITPQEALEQLLPSYERYYDVRPEAHGSFAATARFYTKGEQFFLIKSAKMWEMESNEFVYFLARSATVTVCTAGAIFDSVQSSFPTAKSPQTAMEQT